MIRRRVHARVNLTRAMLLLLVAPTTLWAATNYENITFIQADGHTFVNYETTRSPAKKYTLYLDKKDLLDNYFYINPNNFKLDSTAPDLNKLTFADGNYALISEGDFEDSVSPENSRVTIDESGVYTLKTWNGKKLEDGHFGFWNTPDNFTNFAAAWILPAHYEVVEYFSNRKGEWVERGNTLAFFGNDLNDVTFEIRYQASSHATFEKLKTEMQGVDAIDIEQGEGKVHLVLADEILFGSGSDSLSDAGRAVINKIAAGVGTEAAYEVVVSGHTDNVQIAGELAKRFPTNWELSAKRALNVVHALSTAGIDPTRLQARAYGPFRPRVPNISEANRRTNRRIEITIQPVE